MKLKRRMELLACSRGPERFGLRGLVTLSRILLVSQIMVPQGSIT